MGDQFDKKRIERLMYHRAPGNHTYEFAYICDSFVAYLVEYDVKDSCEFTSTIPEFLEYFEIDLREMNGYHHNLVGYLADVQQALGYFLIYLDKLNFLPVPESLKVSEGTRLSVLTFEVEIPNRRQPSFSIMRNV